MRRTTDRARRTAATCFAAVALMIGQPADNYRSTCRANDGQRPGRDNVARSRQDVAKARRKQRMVAVFGRRLMRLPLSGATKERKRSPDDFFVLGTAEMDAATRRADVRFETVQGQTEVAERLADFILDTPKRTVRKWHVFARFKDGETAEDGIRLIRARYDQLKQYRAYLAKLYAAQATRRT